MDESSTYDVVVVGGGPAGLNGALILARSRRSVVVIDSGEPRNAPADGIHGLLGHDGTPPPQLLASGRAEVRGYGGQIVDGLVIRAARDAAGFVVELEDGRSLHARRLLVTAGVIDELPDIPGLRERWGKDVLHCPYCHGWEVRDQAIGVLASGPNSIHQALLFRQLSEDVVYFPHKMPPEEEQAQQLAARSIHTIEGQVSSIEVDDGRLVGVRLSDGTVIKRDVLVVSTRLTARATFLSELGLTPTEHPSGLGEHIKVDAVGQTDVPGVWAAGNLTDPAAQVGGSAAAGALAAIRINTDLVAGDTTWAIAAHGEGLVAGTSPARKE